MRLSLILIELVISNEELCNWSENLNLACSATSVSVSFDTPSSNDNCADIFRNSDGHQYRPFLAKGVDDPLNEHCAIGNKGKSAEQSPLSERKSENIISEDWLVFNKSKANNLNLAMNGMRTHKSSSPTCLLLKLSTIMALKNVSKCTPRCQSSAKLSILTSVPSSLLMTKKYRAW